MTIPNNVVQRWVDVGYFTKDMVDYIFENSDIIALSKYLSKITVGVYMQNRYIGQNEGQLYIDMHDRIGTEISSFNDILKIMKDSYRTYVYKSYRGKRNSFSDLDREASTNIESLTSATDHGDMDYFIKLSDTSYSADNYEIDFINMLSDTQEEKEILTLIKQGHSYESASKQKGINPRDTKKYINEFRVKLLQYIEYGYSVCTDKNKRRLYQSQIIS